MDCGEIGPFCLWPLSPCQHHADEAAQYAIIGHARCTEQFCRAPLHPGPCKRFRVPQRGLPRRDTGEPDIPGTSAQPPSKHQVPTGTRGGDGHPPAPVGRDQLSDRAAFEETSTQMAARLQGWRAQDAAWEQEWLDAIKARPGQYPDPDPAKMPPANGNRNTGAAAEQAGFTGPPVVASDAELDAAVAAGGVDMWRGVNQGYDTRTGRDLTPEETIEQLRTGDAYYGQGIYGNGMYFGDDHQISSEYAGGQRFFEPGGRPQRAGAVVRAVLRPGSKVIEFEDARDQRDAWARQMEQVPVDERMRPDQAKEWQRRVQMVSGDLGAWAALMGYDAIYADEARHGRSQGDQSRHFSVLNRGALMVSDQTESVRP